MSKFRTRISTRDVDDILPFGLIVICVASARFVESESTVFSIFIVTLAIYVWRKYDARILVGIALFLLIGCTVLLVRGFDKSADEVAIWAYYFLVIGVLGLLITSIKGKTR